MWHPQKKKKTTPNKQNNVASNGGKSTDYVESVRESQYYKRAPMSWPDFSDHKLKLWPQVLEPLVTFCTVAVKHNEKKI